jgi:hypothetical protein
VKSSGGACTCAGLSTQSKLGPTLSVIVHESVSTCRVEEERGPRWHDAVVSEERCAALRDLGDDRCAERRVAAIHAN